MGAKRKTPKDYIELAKSRNFRWIGEFPRNTQTKTIWECEKQHRWETCYQTISKGKGCPTCGHQSRAKKSRLKPADYHLLAQKRNFVWHGPEIPNTRTKTVWECEKGHKWEARYSSIQQGDGCPCCAGIKRKESHDYHALAIENNIKWLGPYPRNTNSKTWWECDQNHTWFVPYNSIRSGRGCMACYLERIGKTEDNYKAIAKENGFTWVGERVPNGVIDKTKWQCQHGHQWEAHFANISSGFGCPYCAGNILKDPEDYHAVAMEFNLKWLGSEVPNVRTKTRWECEEGHQWETVYTVIKNGHGCPFCAGVAPKSAADYLGLAQEYGIKWTGTITPPNTRTETSWQCEKGHHWESSYSYIGQGHGCKTCARARVPPFESTEVPIAKALDELEIEHQSQYSPPKCRFIFDEWIPPDILLEIHGSYWHASPQHYEENDLDKIQRTNRERDERKVEWVERYGYKLAVIWEHEISAYGAETLIRERVMPLL